MSTVLNLIALGAIAGFVTGKVKLKTTMYVAFGAILLANVMPGTSSNATTTTS